MEKIRLTALFLLVLGALTGYFIYSSEISPESNFKFKLGLDLDGGTHLTYRADTSDIDPIEVPEAMTALRDTIERRINIFGVSEPIVQVETGGIFSDDENDNRLIVELPGVTDVTEAIRQIGQTPTLEFRLEDETSTSSVNFLALQATSSEEIAEQIRNQYESTGLTGAQLDRSRLVFDQMTGSPTIALDFNSEGREMFAGITKNNIGKSMGIFLDGILISDPVIQSEIPNGQAVITGVFSPEEARELVRNLNLGALPVPIELIETQTIGPSLGAETLEKGIEALLIGFAIIFVFLVSLYRLKGLVASVALAIYLIIMLALFKLIPVTLTSSGLAGFILSIGMAVDANILIFERIKEELKKGVGKYDAVKEGTAKAWTSIRDGNITSIISAVVLYWLSGTSVVQGFALVFGIGVLVSMFTAVVVTKVILLALTNKK
ncbi:protein translocase subunit SecD [Candidatus Parcubacteria bacterium]|nr:protein translocase subunit SecD [Candidatus Parcubacteria bacterium]